MPTNMRPRLQNTSTLHIAPGPTRVMNEHKMASVPSSHSILLQESTCIIYSHRIFEATWIQLIGEIILAAQKEVPGGKAHERTVRSRGQNEI